MNPHTQLYANIQTCNLRTLCTSTHRASLSQPSRKRSFMEDWYHPTRSYVNMNDNETTESQPSSAITTTTELQASATSKQNDKYKGMREGVIYRLPRGSVKEFIVLVDGHPIRFGDPKMENHEDDKDARDNFRSRHKCDEKKDRHSAGYWSCKAWQPGFEARALPEGVDL